MTAAGGVRQNAGGVRLPWFSKPPSFEPPRHVAHPNRTSRSGCCSPQWDQVKQRIIVHARIHVARLLETLLECLGLQTVRRWVAEYYPCSLSWRLLKTVMHGLFQYYSRCITRRKLCHLSADLEFKTSTVHAAAVNFLRQGSYDVFANLAHQESKF